MLVKTNNQIEKNALETYPLLDIEPEGVHVRNGKEELKTFVQYGLKPQIEQYVQSETEKIQKISTATEIRAGLVRIATLDEVNRLSEDSMTVLTPLRARGVFLDKDRFVEFENEVENTLAEKADIAAYNALVSRVNEIEENITAVEAALDVLNGEVI